MAGSVKCAPDCTCRKHNRSYNTSPEERRARQAESSRVHYEAHRDELLERQRQRRRDPIAGEELRTRERERKAALPPEERERRTKRHRDWYRQNPRMPEKNAEAHYRARYRLTLEQRAQMIADQDGCCYLCREPLPDDKRKIHTDHDRSCCPRSTTCGMCIRGIACENCNTGIGRLGEDPDRMRRIADNLEKANARIRSR